jgi:dihydroflavonol-4-reductase
MYYRNHGMTTKILLTGASGFIGYNIVKQLTDYGHNVRMLVRKNDKLLHFPNSGIVLGDVRNRVDVMKVIQGCDIVIHTAGLFTFDPSKKDEIYDINVNGTENICKAVLENKIKRFIYTSSAATIGKSKELLSDENTSFNLWNISSHYKKSKVLAENVVIDYFRKYDIPVIILNPSLPLGKYDFKPTSTEMMVKSFIDSKVKACINGGFNFVHVDDVAKAHRLCIDKGRIGERYIIGNENISLKGLYEKIQIYVPEGKRINIPYPVALVGAGANVLIRVC